MTASDRVLPDVAERQDDSVEQLPGPSAPLRCAIAGAGRMGQHHARALRRLNGSAHVVAVADPAAASRDGVRQIWPRAGGFGSLDEVLASVDIDIVHVCTAPESHDALATMAIESGRHVYVEKPVTDTAAKAKRLTALARQRGVQLCAGHQLLFEAPMRRMLDLLPAIGSVVHVESFFAFRPVRSAPGGRGALAPDLQLLDVLPHPVYLLLHLLEQADPQGESDLTGLEMGCSGSVHALLRRGVLSGTLIVTLEGRPVESYLRVVGTNGTLIADFVRGTVQHLIGPGTSGIDKVLNPFRLARQLVVDTSAALGARALKRQRSYPGLAEIFQAFHDSIRIGGPPPVSPESIVETVRVCEQIARVVRRGDDRRAVVGPSPAAPGALITGGTGFLGKVVVEALTIRGTPVRSVGRRLPAQWERASDVDYVSADLGDAPPSELFDGVDVVVHCAAETAGGWDAHRRNSLDATERVMRAAAAAGVRRFIHVSSLATLAASGRPLRDEDPLEPRPAECGPYVWGKVESELLARRLGDELGLDVQIVRPAALIDYGRFDPPGKLGRRVGNIFVAVGSPREKLAVVDLYFAGRTIAWMATHFERAPRVLNLLAPTLPTRRELLSHLRRANPDLRVVWLPRPALVPLSLAAMAAQRVLRRGKPVIDVAKVFKSQRFDTSRISMLAPEILADTPAMVEA